MASLMVLAMPCPSLPIIYFHWCCVASSIIVFKYGDGAFKCSLYPPLKVLADSPMYSSSHSILPHLYQYIMLLCFLISREKLKNLCSDYMAFSVIWMCCFWHQHNMVPMSCEQYICIHYVKTIEMMYNITFFGHVIPLMLVPVSLDTNNIINSIISFVRSRLSKWHATWLLWSCNATCISISIMWYQWYYQCHHCICSVKIIKMWCNICFMAMKCLWCCYQCHLMQTCQ